MTDNQTPQVEQCDRELFIALGIFKTCTDQAVLEWGHADDCEEMQLIARHRAGSASGSGEVEHPRERFKALVAQYGDGDYKIPEREIERLARDMCAFPDIRAPVQGFPGGIPWEMHMRAYEGYCAKYRGQVALINLYGRGCRGGFGTGELDDFIPGWRDQLSERTALLKRIAELEALTAHRGQPEDKSK